MSHRREPTHSFDCPDSLSVRQKDIKNRASLRFTDLAQQALSFLPSYGFRLRSSEATLVRYESDQAFVNVYHGRSSYEIGVEVGPVSRGRSGTTGYTMSELIRLSNRDEGERFRNFMATTAEEVKVGLQQLAEQLLRYGNRALKGDGLIFEALQQQRQEWVSAFAADVTYRQTSPEAAEAFRQREYGKAAELYESIRDKLTPAELKKLEYAKRHA